MKLSLAKINFLNTIITAIVFTVCIGSLEIYTSYKNFYNKVERNKARYIDAQKIKHENRVKKTVSVIQNDILLQHKTLKYTLEEKIYEINFIYKKIKNKNPNKNSKELFKLFIKELEVFRNSSNIGDYYIFNENKTIVYHANNKEIIGKSVYDYKSSKGLQDVIEKALIAGQSSGQYAWLNPKNGKNENKFVVIKKIESTSLYLASGFYGNEIEENIKNNIKNLIETTRFNIDDKSYFWIHSLEGHMIYNPMQLELNGKSILNYKNKNGKYPFKEMNDILKNNDSGFLSYMWKYPNSNDKEEQKISYFKKLGKYNWVIGSGFYFRTQNSIVQEEESILKKELSDNLINMFLILGIISFVTIIISYLIGKKINNNEEEKQIHLNMLEQYKVVLDESSIVSKTDKHGLITYVNKKFEESCGYTNKELLGKSHNLLRHKSMPKEFFKNMWERISVGLIWCDIIRNTNKNAESYYVSTTIIPIKDKNGDIVEYISASNNITKLITTNNLLENFALTDGLTGLGSRVKLMNDFKKDNVLAIVDINKFTEVNDMYGQDIGDIIIKEVANEIFEFAKNNNIQTYRLHADVFALLSDTKNTNTFINQIKNLVRYLQQHHFDKDNVNATFNFIAGISYGDGEVLACADMALKNAKRNHKSVGVYSKDNNLLEEYKNNEKWMKVVTKALEDDRIVPYFQPIYSYKDSTVKKYESLMRLIEEDGTVVSPFAFLNIIKQTSIYARVTQTMIRKTVDMFRYTNSNSFSINITLEDLLNTETMQYFYSIIASENLFERLIIEIVETEELANFEKVSEILGEFKARGTKVAIDDFGTGYSNYNYLRKLDVDFIKIDGSIIENIEDSKTKELVSTILDFAKKSGMQTIAEFVSSKEIDKSVQELGVDFAQGYFRGKPSPSI